LKHELSEILFRLKRANLKIKPEVLFSSVGVVGNLIEEYRVFHRDLAHFILLALYMSAIISEACIHVSWRWFP
jgi:hypothetical protein